MDQKSIKCFFVNSMTYFNCSDFILDLLNDISRRCNQKISYNHENPSINIQKFKKNLTNLTKRNYIVVMIDELENLLNKDKNGFEHIIEFFNIHVQGFVKIGISNTLDLFSDVAKSSKMYMLFNFLVFKPYTEDRIINILQTKLKEVL